MGSGVFKNGFTGVPFFWEFFLVENDLRSEVGLLLPVRQVAGTIEKELGKRRHESEQDSGHPFIEGVLCLKTLKKRTVRVSRT